MRASDAPLEGGGAPKWYGDAVPTFSVRHSILRIPDQIAKTVVFLGIRKAGKFIPKATAFIVSFDQGGYGFYHLVTAEHVISGLVTKGHKIYLRINVKEGPAEEFELDASGWTFHPDTALRPTDVAVAPLNISHRPFDFAAIPLSGEKSQVCTSDVVSGEGIGIGDEIAVVGLFRNHAGVDRNIPVVRIGNLATMSDEPILTRYCGHIEGYLVEARSISGLSGSPVLINMAPYRIVNGKIHQAAKAYYLFGLMHGHFDVQNLNDDVVADEGDSSQSGIHTGMGVVVPADKIIETLNHPDLVAGRAAHIAKMRSEGGATPDLALEESEPRANPDNPSHKEDFTRLLSAAAKTKRNVLV